MSKLLQPILVGFALLLVCGVAHGGPSAPPRAGEEPEVTAGSSTLQDEERCRTDLDARVDTIIRLNGDIEELKADRSAALSALEECRDQKTEAWLEVERLRCILHEGKKLNPSTLRCEGAVLYKIILTTP